MQPATSVTVAPPPYHDNQATAYEAPSSSENKPVATVTVAPPPYNIQTTPYEAASSSYNQPVTTVNVARTQPDNHLCFAIFVTLCCCFPLGIIGIVFSQMSSSKFNRGDDVGAVKYAESANKYSLAGLLAGVVAIIIIALKQYVM
ncbi:synapse differentiation-inducing gene protein 1-like isoform X2 [Anneissia japonica]|nr:synapse differentiation-inducing gene protein 1-like isoform X2 [Anneissia japonica]